MSWREGSGRIGVGTTTQTTEKEGTNVLLPGGWDAVVDRTTLKLVRKP